MKPEFLKIRLKVGNQKLQAKLDKVNGWREAALVVASVVITAVVVWLAFKSKVLP